MSTQSLYQAVVIVPKQGTKFYLVFIRWARLLTLDVLTLNTKRTLRTATYFSRQTAKKRHDKRVLFIFTFTHQNANDCLVSQFHLANCTVVPFTVCNFSLRVLPFADLIYPLKDIGRTIQTLQRFAVGLLRLNDESSTLLTVPRRILNAYLFRCPSKCRRTFADRTRFADYCSLGIRI